VQNFETVTHASIVTYLSDIFDHSGAKEYLGEPVTMAQHMLQAASLAQHKGLPDHVIGAALLHDIGHFTNDFGTFSMEDTIDLKHEAYGAKVLAPFFPEALTHCVAHHVSAKRYLCATRETYFSKLSPASVHSLNLQGGPMDAAEVAKFESNPYLHDIIQVRLLDDEGKVADMKTFPFAHFQPLLQKLVNQHQASLLT
jgi:phosphonate degradation associated HDIG domain protein